MKRWDERWPQRWRSAGKGEFAEAYVNVCSVVTSSGIVVITMSRQLCRGQGGGYNLH